MQEKAKMEALKNAGKGLARYLAVKSLNYGDTETDFMMSCEIEDEIRIECGIRKKTDMLILKCVSTPDSCADEAALGELGAEIAEHGNGLAINADGDTLEIRSVVSLQGVEDEDAKEAVFREVFHFSKLINEFRVPLSKSGEAAPAPASEENPEDDGEAIAQMYSQIVSDSDEPVLAESGDSEKEDEGSKTGEDEKDTGEAKSEPRVKLSKDKNKSPSPESDPRGSDAPEADMSIELDLGQTSKPSDEDDAEEDALDSAIRAMELREKKRRQASMGDAKNKKTGKGGKPDRDGKKEKTDRTDKTDKDDKSDKTEKSDNTGKAGNADKPDKPDNSANKTDKTDGGANAGKAGQSAKPEKNYVYTVPFPGADQAAKPDPSVGNAKSDPSNLDDACKQFPELYTLKKRLYEEARSTLEDERKQLMELGKTLNKYSQKLDQRSRVLDKRETDINKDYQAKKEQQESREAELTIEKEELDFQIQKLTEKEESIRNQQKAMEEERGLYEKMRSMDSDVPPDVYDRLNALMDEKDKLAAQLETEKSERGRSDKKTMEIQEEIHALKVKMNTMVPADMANIDAKEFTALKDANLTLSEENAAIKEQLESLRAEYESLVDESSQKMDIIRTQQEKQKRWKNRENDYKKQIGKLRKNADAAKDMVPKADAEALKEEIGRLQAKYDLSQNTVKELEMNADSMRELIEDLQGQAEQAKAEARDALEQARAQKEEYEKAMEQAQSGVSSDPANALPVRDALSAIGVYVEPIASAGDGILSGEKDGCMICVDLGKQMIYIEKKVKKATRFKAKVEDWNLEDICRAYMYTDTAVTAKASYRTDAAKPAADILEKFEEIQ